MDYEGRLCPLERIIKPKSKWNIKWKLGDCGLEFRHYRDIVLSFESARFMSCDSVSGLDLKA